jgi:hypothetical protein
MRDPYGGRRRTLVDIEVTPGGGNVLDRHHAFSERFEGVERELIAR